MLVNMIVKDRPAISESDVDDRNRSLTHAVVLVSISHVVVFTRYSRRLENESTTLSTRRSPDVTAAGSRLAAVPEGALQHSGPVEVTSTSKECRVVSIGSRKPVSQGSVHGTILKLRSVVGIDTTRIRESR